MHQQIWMLAGQMEIRLGKQIANLRSGDCMSMTLEAPITFHNNGEKDARYLLAVTRSPR